MKKSVIFASVLAALATPVMAETVNPGLAMQARLLGVEPGKYTGTELAGMSEARREGDWLTEKAIRDRAIRPGFDSKYAVDGSKLSSNDN